MGTIARFGWIVASLLLAATLWLAGSGHASADSTVVVQRGDNLFRIGLRHGVSVDAIMRRNGLASANTIYAGQRLVIPDGRTSSAPSSGRDASAGAPNDGGTALHVVAAGETLFRIALRYGTTAESLARLNGLRQANVIFAGQRLVVPRSGSGGTGSTGSPPAASGGGGRSIVIDLSDQRLYAYEGSGLVASFVVSTGKASTPTPVGSFGVYSRYKAQDMSGPGYYAPGVPWVQYFTGAYALHGTYWHDSFGLPVSHGCVNMRTPDAQWLFFWSRIGTPVRVQW